MGGYTFLTTVHRSLAGRARDVVNEVLADAREAAWGDVQSSVPSHVPTHVQGHVHSHVQRIA